MKIKLTALSLIVFASISATVLSNQELSESNLLVKEVLSSNYDNEILNNETLNYKKAIKNGNIVMISFLDKPSIKTNNDHEIYNIKNLDRFMENVNQGKKDKIRIVKYVRKDEKTWVNKLYDLEYDGHKIFNTAYDTYSDPNAFIPSSDPYGSDYIEKRDYPNDLWYGGITENKEGKKGYSIISFKKSSIIN
ncbi:hypothetical protein SH2C18_04090 [Clostridium sediminicola]|uniref:DUF4362 domain-containing protein n=1 Tax=Clostridium sediminicola TaxID=3114879 RepID=UPI0031F1D261